MRQCQAHATDSADKQAQNGDSGAQRKLDGLVDGGQDSEDENKWAKPFSAGQIFGSYLQLGVWITVLSGAAFVGFQKVRASSRQHGIHAHHMK